MRYTPAISKLHNKTLRPLIVAFVITFFAAVTADAQTAAVSARVGSLGLGGEVGVAIGDDFGARFSLNGLSFSFESEEDDIDYDFDVDLFTAGLLGDFYFSRIFRLSAGAMINKNEAAMTAAVTDEVDIGNGTYTAEEVGNLTGEVSFSNVRPYVGIGLDTSHGKRGAVGFVAEIGALFHGTPRVALMADGLARNDAGFQADLEIERSDVEDDLSDFTVYPVIALGISYRF